MPAKVVKPDGNQAHPNNCGFLARYDSKDSNGALMRIPFVNKDNKFKNGDLVIIEVVDNLSLTDSKGNTGNIAVAILNDICYMDKWGDKEKEIWEKEWGDEDKAKYDTSESWRNHHKYVSKE